MIGNGQKVRVWEDPWVPWLENFKPMPKVGVSQQQTLMVYQRMDDGRRNWNLAKLRELFEENTVIAIFKIPLSMRNRPNKLIWVAHPLGKFTVKSSYYLQQGILPSTESTVNIKARGAPKSFCQTYVA